MSDLYLSNEMTILSLSVSSHPFPLSCVSTQSELLIRIISGMIYISSDLSVGISTIDDGMKLGIRLLLTILLGIESYYGGLHCGDCFDVKVRDVWIPVRIEMDENWYLVGLSKTRLGGLTVRM